MKQLTNFIKASILFVAFISLTFNFGACRKSSTNIEHTTPSVPNPTSNPIDTICPITYKPTYDIDSVIGTYIATDTLLLYSHPENDTVISTLEFNITARGANMIQFDTFLRDFPKFSNHRYSLDTSCTIYSYYTSYTPSYYASTYIFMVDVSFTKDTMYYKSYNSYFGESHFGKGIKRR